ncbi:MAG: Fur family transcriptional regulator [Thermodesulfovibrionales bacterium]
MNKMKDIGIRLTPQRMAILEYLEGNKEHPSAEDIYKDIIQRFPTMSFATVYNTLETLKRIGNVRELTIDPVRKRYDPDTSSHHHMICTECKRIYDVHIDIHVEIPDEQADNFKVINNHIEFYGLCKECSKHDDYDIDQ